MRVYPNEENYNYTLDRYLIKFFSLLNYALNYLLIRDADFEKYKEYAIASKKNLKEKKALAPKNGDLNIIKF